MYNSYLNNNQYGQYYPSYMQGAYGNYQSMQSQQRQNPMQPQQQVQPQEMPFSDVRYGTLDEAKGHIVMPGKAVMFINRNLGEFYVKSANNMGEPLLETFKYSKLDDNMVETKPVAIDTSQFVKPEDLKGFITREDLSGFITQDDLKGFAVELDKLRKRIEINEIERGNVKNGK